jgi:hypothetical protein
MKSAETEEAGKEAWKKEYETYLAHDVDRALMAEAVCRIVYGTSPKCEVGIEWNHAYETRAAILKNEFLYEMDATIRRAIRDTLSQDL